MSTLFSGPKVITPTVAPPTPMPDTEDPQVLAEKRRALALAATRGGRQSTILSGGALGGAPAAQPVATGDSYSKTTLGGA